MNNAAGDIVLHVQGLEKSFQTGDRSHQVLRGADLDVRAGEVVALLGPSGSGKSTFLQIVGLLDQADSGTVSIAGHDASALKAGAATAMRRDLIGFVYQFHHLLPEFTALENVILPQRTAGVSKGEAGARAAHLLSGFGLADRLDHRPAQMSGGEQQRVAIARAMANDPKLILADEPTGNLDEDTSKRVFDAFMHMARDEGVAVLFVTHNLDLARAVDRMMVMDHGQIRQA